MSVITESLHKSYGDNSVLDDLTVSLGTHKNNIVGIVGRNGIGKTTFIEIVTGSMAQDSGSVETLGHSLPDERNEVKEKIGVLPENMKPATHLTVSEFLTLYGLERGLSESEINRNIKEWAELFGFTSVLDTLCQDISQGQKQMVMITQAFIHSPELVFIDEPLTNLDPHIQNVFVDKLKDYAESGNTVILTTHNTHFAMDVCSEILVFGEDSTQLVTDVDNYTESEIVDAISGGDINE